MNALKIVEKLECHLESDPLGKFLLIRAGDCQEHTYRECNRQTKTMRTTLLSGLGECWFVQGEGAGRLGNI